MGAWSQHLRLQFLEIIKNIVRIDYQFVSCKSFARISQEADDVIVSCNVKNNEERLWKSQTPRINELLWTQLSFPLFMRTIIIVRTGFAGKWVKRKSFVHHIQVRVAHDKLRQYKRCHTPKRGTVQLWRPPLGVLILWTILVYSSWNSRCDTSLISSIQYISKAC